MDVVYELIHPEKNVWAAANDDVAEHLWEENKDLMFRGHFRIDEGGMFVPINDVYDRKILMCNIKYTAKLRELIPNGYEYQCHDYALYMKEVSQCQFFFIYKMIMEVQISDNRYQSGWVLKWLIENDFSDDCIGTYFLCNNTGHIRKQNEDLLYDNELPFESRRYMDKGIMEELKRLHTAGAVETTEPEQANLL